MNSWRDEDMDPVKRMDCNMIVVHMVHTTVTKQVPTHIKRISEIKARHKQPHLIVHTLIESQYKLPTSSDLLTASQYATKDSTI